MENKFKIVHIADVLDYIDEKEIIKLDSFTMAKLYKGSNSLYYLIPAVGYKGIEASNENVLDSILESKHIPIEEDTNNFFAENREIVSDLPDSASNFILSFFEKNNLKINLTNISFDQAAFNQLINSEKGSNRYERFSLITGVLFGEKLRIEKHVSWKLEKRYGYNPYYIPTLYNANSKVSYDPWFFLTRTLSSNKKFDFEAEYRRIMKISM